MNILIIDDERTLTRVDRSIGWPDRIIYARDLAEAYAQLWDTNIVWDRVYLDHDLGDGQDVSDLTNRLEREAYAGEIFPIRKFIIHSMNPVGRRAMFDALHRFYNVEFARVEDLL